MRRRAPAAAAAAAALAARGAAAYSALRAFGDSWVDDNGVNGTWKRGSWPPSPPNAYRWSNGPTFPFYLGKALGLDCGWDAPDTPAGLACDQYTNYAVGGACTKLWTEVEMDRYCTFKLCQDDQLTGCIRSPPFYPDQVTSYLNSNHDAAGRGDVLFVINIGGNDMNGMLSLNQAGGVLKVVDSLVNKDTEAMDAIVAGVRMLWEAGARKFFLLNLPPAPLTPLVRGKAAVLRHIAEEWIDEFLEQWEERVHTPLRALGDGASVTVGNIRGCMRQLEVGRYGGWAGHGFTNPESRCLADTDDPDASACESPDQYVWWDAVHPTTKFHEFMGNQAKFALPQADGGSAGNGTAWCLLDECYKDSLLSDCFESSATAFTPWSLAAMLSAGASAILLMP